MVPKLGFLKARIGISHLSAIVLYIFLTIVLTFPLILHMNDWLNAGDSSLNTWILAWGVHSLTTDPLNLFNANMFYPFTQNTLAFSEHLFADVLIAFPVILITHNPVLAYNLILILSFILSGYGMFLLIDYYIKDKYSAFIVGIIFAFCTIRFAHFGHLQLLTVQWIPFALLYLDKFLHGGRYKDLTLLYVFYVLQVLSSWYLAFYTTIVIGAYIFSIFILNKEIYGNLSQRSYQLKLILALTCSAATVAPFAIPYFQVAQEYGFERSLAEVSSFSADVGDYFLTMIGNLIYGSISTPIQLNRNFCEHSLFPGITAIILALYGIFCFKKFKINNQNKVGMFFLGGEKRDIFIFILILSFILSLGYPLHFFGHIINIDLPYKFFWEFLPGFKSMRVPSRFGIIFMLSLSVLAGYGLNRLIKFRSHKFVIAVIIMLFILVENLYIPVAFETTPVGQEIPDVYKWLGNDTNKFAIVEIPIGNLWYDSRYSYFSTYHWKSLVNGYSGFSPDYYPEISSIIQTFPSNDSINTLQKIGVKYVILHSKLVGSNESMRIQKEILNYNKSAKLIMIFGDDYVYRLNETRDSPSIVLPFTGFYSSEDWNGVPTRWTKSDAVLQIYSSNNYTTELSLQALSFCSPRTLEVYVSDTLAMQVTVPSTGFINVTMPIHLMKGANKVRFYVPEGCERPSDKLELNNPDSRCLSMAVQNITLT